jgi:hypothetical protein
LQTRQLAGRSALRFSENGIFSHNVKHGMVFIGACQYRADCNAVHGPVPRPGGFSASAQILLSQPVVEYDCYLHLKSGIIFQRNDKRNDP